MRVKDLSSENFKSALKKANVIYVPPFELNPPLLAGESTELIDIVVGVSGLSSFEEEINDAIEIKLTDFSIKVLSLEKIIKSKKSLGRPKDKLVLPVLEDVLKTIKIKDMIKK